MERTRRLLVGISIVTVLLSASAFASFSENSYNPNPIPNFILSAMAFGDWQTIVADSVTIDLKNDQTSDLSLQTVIPIPPNERILQVGFAWLYEDGASGYAVMTHNGVRDSNQNPYGWHVHGDLAFVELEVTASATHCVTGIGDYTQAGANFNQGGVSINVRNSELSTFMDPPTGISFSLIPLSTSQCPSGIGLALYQVQPMPSTAAEEEDDGGKGGGKGGNPNK